MPLFIRPATLADASTINDFNCRLAFETEHKTLDPPTVAKGVAAILTDCAKGLYFMAEIDQVVVGQTSVTTEWSDWRNAWWWWIQSVYVRAEGRRQGVFRALYQYVEQAARRQGDVIGLRLYVEENNHAAQQTYRRMGMNPLGFFLYQKYLEQRLPSPG